MLFDLAILVIFIFAARAGWKSGFLNSLSFAAALVVSIFFAHFFIGIVFNFLEGTNFHYMLSDGLEQNLGFYRIPLFGNTLTVGVTNIVLNFISYLIVFALIFVGIRVLISLVSGIIHKIPLVGFANRILGLLLGLLKATILIWVLLIIVVIFYDINNSFLAVWFAQRNLILYLIVG